MEQKASGARFPLKLDADRNTQAEMMKAWSHFTKLVLVFAFAGLWGFAMASSARAQQALDPDTQSVLAAMSNYLGGLKNFSVEYSAVDEVVTQEGQKLQFLHSGKVIVQRPNKLYAIRTGATGSAEMFLDGKELTLYAKTANDYLQLDATTIDTAISALHKFGFEAPGADLLAAKPLDSSTADMTSGAHVGMTFIDGAQVHQLAFRGADVDWQLWVKAGSKPLPLRYVITTKAIGGAPQYTLELRNWDVTPQIGAGQFAFTPPKGAKKLDPASVKVDAIGDMTIKGE
ncbi:MAG TPA: hypothetical protein DDZ81_04945 [Acetobacteraceae bacterium]|jgi:hypothetical protein|nr:hypothetical protein [Acetobacteraceae bacterium]